MPRYDLDTVKQAARGRWADVLSALGQVGAEVLDGREHGCPRCGGNDRFRAMKDFNETGAVFCNQCFSTKNGDGIAAVMWLTGVDFVKALSQIAEYLGVKGTSTRKKTGPFDHLQELPWNPTAALLWCNKKAPIKPEALVKLGAKYCMFRKKFTVFAIPVWGPQLDANDAVGWIIYRSDGGELPRYGKKGEEPVWKKVLLTPGSEQGIVTCLDDWKKLKTDPQSQVWWKLEGSTDLLSTMGQEWPEGHYFWTTANGSTERPSDWMIESMAGTHVRVCHDADEPGQEGATWVKQGGGRKRAGWCPALAAKAKDARNVMLPFVVERVHGPDIRDYWNGGGVVSELLKLADKSEVEGAAGPAARGVIRSITNGKRLAEMNLLKYEAEYKRSLVYWRGEWYSHKQSRYERLDREHVEIRLRESIERYFEDAWLAGEDARDSSREVTISIVKNALDAMKGICFISPSVNLDTWRNGGPNQCIAFKNKILSLEELFARKQPEEYLFDHTPDWFSVNCLPYEFDASALCPLWNQFLWDVFEDEESIETLQRWFGYLLLPDTSLEKMMFIIGPTRSGKGTILKVIQELFGESLVACPRLSDLPEQYELHTLFGKTIAIIPDARLSKRADREAITERLLSISANDPQDVQRKYMSTMTGVRMNLRFTLFSNKLPELDDSSAAMVGRGIYLMMRNSFIGRENLDLKSELLTELPGILNWAIAGRYALQNDRVIRQPEISKHYVRHMRINMAPVDQFLRECCEVKYDDGSVVADDLFEAWCNWAKENAYSNRMSITEFERRAIDANPVLRSDVRSVGGMSTRCLLGVRLKV